MTLRAPHRESQPNRSNRVRAIYDLLKPRFLSLDAGLVILEAIAMKPGRDQKVRGRIGNQVARDLGASEFVEGHVVVESLNHPVTPAPGVGSGLILLVAVTVGV